MSTYVKPITWLFGIVLTAIGILGLFMPSPLLGLFDVNLTHTMIHIVSGVVALIAVSMSYSYARLYLIFFGLVYGLATILGFANILIVDMLNMNAADNYLHLAIAIICLLVGLGSKETMRTSM